MAHGVRGFSICKRFMVSDMGVLGFALGLQKL